MHNQHCCLQKAEKHSYLKLVDKSPPESIMQNSNGRLRQKYFLPFDAQHFLLVLYNNRSHGNVITVFYNTAQLALILRCLTLHDFILSQFLLTLFVT